jgi:hypothetical protein
LTPSWSISTIRRTSFSIRRALIIYRATAERSWLPRVNLLIADNVGLGKTDEAGLVVRELLPRRIDLIVIFRPPAIFVQWKDELESKFGVVGHPKLYSRAMVEEVTAANPRACPLEATCREIRRTCTFLPSAAEVLKILRKQMEHWCDLCSIFDKDLMAWRKRCHVLIHNLKAKLDVVEPKAGTP